MSMPASLAASAIASSDEDDDAADGGSNRRSPRWEEDAVTAARGNGGGSAGAGGGGEADDGVGITGRLQRVNSSGGADAALAGTRRDTSFPVSQHKERWRGGGGEPACGFVTSSRSCWAFHRFTVCPFSAPFFPSSLPPPLSLPSHVRFASLPHTPMFQSRRKKSKRDALKRKKTPNFTFAGPRSIASEVCHVVLDEDQGQEKGMEREKEHCLL